MKRRKTRPGFPPKGGRAIYSPPVWDPATEPVSSKPTIRYGLGPWRFALLFVGLLAGAFAIALAVMGLVHLFTGLVK
jgi:hypothetical protein